MHWFDIFIAVITVIAIIRGFSSGIITQLASLAGIVLGAIFAGKFAEILAPKIIDITGTNVHYIGPISYIMAFLTILILFSFLGKVVDKIVKTIYLGFLNRVLGAVFCCIKYLVVVSILLNLVVQFDQNKTIIKEDTRVDARTYPLVMELTSKVIPFLRFDQITSSLPS